MPSPERYLARIGLDPADFAAADRETLASLQRAHVTTVPFENLAITGDPHGDREGEGVVLTLPHCYEKVVERELGGFCFELNGLFGWLLGELGFDVDRTAARVVGSDGDDTPPANHHSLLVHLDESHVVDVGLGSPKLRRPLALDGTPHEDGSGVTWRVVESDRPDVDSAVESHEPGEEAFSVRYRFDATPRTLSYFEATCDYLQSAPESMFTGDPFVTLATERGYRKLTADSLFRVERGEEREVDVPRAEWHDVLEREFRLNYPHHTE